MQEIKTIWQDVSTQDRCKFADALLNDHLSDGWTILNIATSATHEDGGIYRAAMLVRDIMATEPAPAETPRNDNAIPKTMRVFVIGQTVRVRDDVDGEASTYTGRTGQVTHLDRSRASGVVRYFTTLSTHDAFYADELEPAD